MSRTQKKIVVRKAEGGRIDPAQLARAKARAASGTDQASQARARAARDRAANPNGANRFVVDPPKKAKAKGTDTGVGSANAIRTSELRGKKY